MLLARLAWRNLWRHRRRTVITGLAMAIGLVAGMATVTLMDGVYVLMFDLMITRNMGHAQLHDPEYPRQRSMWETIDDAGPLVEELRAKPEVVEVAPRLFGAALLGAGEEAAGAQLFGIEPDREDAVSGRAGDVVEGRLPAAGGLEIALGRELAGTLEVGLGDEVVAVAQGADGATANELFQVVGLLETGSVALDRGGAWLQLADLQAFLVLPGQVHEIVAVTDERDAVAGLVAACAPAAEARGLQLRSWREVNPQMAAMMDMGGVFTAIFTLFIMAAAALSVLNTMLMSVFERTRELGVIRALGMGPLQMVQLVIYETVALTVVSCLIGLPVAAAVVAYLVIHGLDLSGVMGGFSMMGMRFNTLYMGELDVPKLLATVAGLFVIALAAALWPAARAARLRPVDAMQQE